MYSKTELNLQKKGQEATFRSKARWIEKGERNLPMNYFFQFGKAKL